MLQTMHQAQACSRGRRGWTSSKAGPSLRDPSDYDFPRIARSELAPVAGKSLLLTSAHTTSTLPITSCIFQISLTV